MGKSTISMAIFNSNVSLPEGSINIQQMGVSRNGPPIAGGSTENKLRIVDDLGYPHFREPKKM